MTNALKNRWVKIAGQVVVMTALVLGLVAFVGNNKSVTLTVDGQASTVSTFGSTVADVLAESEVEVGELDDVTPAVGEEISDGASIEVVTAKPVNVNVDGDSSTVHTTAATVRELLDELEVTDKSALSAPLTAELASVGAVTISTPKRVTIAVDGKTRKEVTTATTIGDLLQEHDIKVRKDDKLSVAAKEPVEEGIKVKVTRIDRERVEETESIAFGTDETTNSGMYADEEKVTRAGEAGERVKVYEIVLTDGKETSRKLVKEKVTREPVSQKVTVGTKKRPAKVNNANVGGTWQALAECESGGNWSINTGNGYSGGLQFSASSWLGAGGGKYAPYAYMATPSEQIATAEVLRGNGGWGHWPACASKLGLL
ncbi:resuscitation-promoting factor [Arthrobacter sp. CAU 1506]|uniref:resuscitation-promoting factor n=1 Tax=Arthrobacter sp. CAU 1506 TaxID=2560052 RepID=UPI0023EF5689|nr:resuscitation-promoting factor [Arthrobacter sp. CAU 1506]